jgi:hypothetical protein
MARYYLIATIIVVAFGCIVFARRLGSLRDFTLSAPATGTPTVTRGSGENPTVHFGSFSGEGPWVLSALPGCFDQQSSIAGTTMQLTFDVPPARERVAPGTRLRAGNCTVVVRDHDVWVYRDADRLRVPSDARLYRTPKGLTLVYEHAGRAEIRVYRERPPK